MDFAHSSSHTHTALGLALLAAGFGSLEDQIFTIATQAWGKWPSADDGTARYEYVADHLEGDLTFRLIKMYDATLPDKIVNWLLSQAAQEIAAQRPKKNTGVKPVGGGQMPLDTQVMRAPASQYAQPQAGRRSEPATGMLSPNTHVSAAPLLPSNGKVSRIPTAEDRAKHLTILADKQAARAKTQLQVEMRLSHLDTVWIGDKKIGDCTVREVRIWSEQRQKDMRIAGRDMLFAMNLIANLTGNIIIRDYWKDAATVDRIYENAQAEYAA